MTLNVELLDGLPLELRSYPNWVLWRMEWRDGKRTKVPYGPNGRRAKANDPSTWGTFEQVLAIYHRGGYDGIGFQFTDTPYCGLDLDWKKYQGEGFPAEADALLSGFDSYSEVTPSKKGAHIIIRGELPAWATNKKLLTPELELEVYSTGRFFTFTADLMVSTEVEERQELLEATLRELGMVKVTTVKKAQDLSERRAFDGSDSQLWEQMFRSRTTGQDIRALFDGNTSRFGDDRSRADFALCQHLCWWTAGDARRMDGMFRQSALIRSKWDTRHHSDGSTYGEGTIDKVLSGWDGQGFGSRSDVSETADTLENWGEATLQQGLSILQASQAHGRTRNSFTALWESLCTVIAEGLTEKHAAGTARLSAVGMARLYDLSGGQPTARRAQLQYLSAQGLVGPLVRGDIPTAPYLLTVPTDAKALGMWRLPLGEAQGSILPICNKHKDAAHSAKNRTPRRNPRAKAGRSPCVTTCVSEKAADIRKARWEAFYLSRSSGMTRRELERATGYAPSTVREHLRILEQLGLAEREGRVYRSTVTPEEVEQQVEGARAPVVGRRRTARMLERLSYHNTMSRWLMRRAPKAARRIGHHLRELGRYEALLGASA